MIVGNPGRRTDAGLVTHQTLLSPFGLVWYRWSRLGLLRDFSEYGFDYIGLELEMTERAGSVKRLCGTVGLVGNEFAVTAEAPIVSQVVKVGVRGHFHVREDHLFGQELKSFNRLLKLCLLAAIPTGKEDRVCCQ